MRLSTGIRVGAAGRKGRGVFALKPFLPGDLIERAPLISIDDPKDVAAMTGTVINRYWYETDDGGTAVGLGLTSLYNHSSRANAVYEAASSDHTVYIVAHRAIKPGAEITINYNGHPNSRKPVFLKEDPPAEEDEGRETGPVHYAEENQWGADGWVWCGECDVRRTSAPQLVTCKMCQLRMLAERHKLMLWDTESKPPLSRSELLVLLGHAVRRFSNDDMPGYADVVREAVRVLKKKGR